MRDVVDPPERVERHKVRQRVRVRSSSRRGERRRRRTRRLRILAAAVAVVLALLGLSLIPALAVRDRLQEARVELQGAVTALLAGDAAGA
ncbi:MAG TPA: hypothetical protein VHL78_09760, partial [Actinomycetota bacterium]|nr:hypothetical protein [Actinomycetota bacterium]